MEKRISKKFVQFESGILTIFGVSGFSYANNCFFSNDKVKFKKTITIDALRKDIEDELTYVLQSGKTDNIQVSTAMAVKMYLAGIIKFHHLQKSKCSQGGCKVFLSDIRFKTWRIVEIEISPGLSNLMPIVCR